MRDIYTMAENGTTDDVQTILIKVTLVLMTTVKKFTVVKEVLICI